MRLSAPSDLLGREVTCRACGQLLDELESKGLPPRALIEGTVLDVEILRDQQARISWQAYCQLLANAALIWTPEEPEDIGRRSVDLDSPWFRPFISAARLLFSPVQFFRYLIEQVGPLNFACIEHKVEELGARHLRITFDMHAGYEPSLELFLISRGSISALPKVLGLGTAVVEMEEHKRGARFQVHLPPGGGPLWRTRQWFTRHFTANMVAEELIEANQLLHERYRQIIAYKEAKDQAETEAKEARSHQAETSRKEMQLDLVHEAEDMRRQLEALDRIVSLSYREGSQTELFEALLEHGLSLLPHTKRGVFGILGKESRKFEIHAGIGFSVKDLAGFSATADEALRRFSRDVSVLSEGIAMVCDLDTESDKLSLLSQTQALLVVDVCIPGQIDGFMVFGTHQGSKRLARLDREILQRYRRHVLAALSRSVVWERRRQDMDRLLALVPTEARDDEYEQIREQFMRDSPKDRKSPTDRLKRTMTNVLREDETISS